MTITINGHEVKAGDVWLWKNSTTQNLREVKIIHVDETRISPIIVAFENAGVAETSAVSGNLFKPKPKTRKIYVGEGYVYYNRTMDVSFYQSEKRNEPHLKLIETIPAHEIEVEDL